MSGIGFDILAFFVVLIPLVIIHEFGHLLAAKSVKITVLEFGIGMPPRALKLFTLGGTEYTLNWLPLGGFVRPFGEDFIRPKNEEELKADLAEIEGRHIESPKSVFEAGPWERMWFISAGPIANFIAAYLLFLIIAVIGQPYATYDVSVIQVFEDSPAQTAGLQAGDRILKVDGKTVTSVGQFEEAIEDKESFELIVERDGEQLPEPITVIPSEFSMKPEIEHRVIVASVEEASIASEAGILADDVIVEINGQAVTDQAMLEDALANAEAETTFTIRRFNHETNEIETIEVIIPAELLSEDGFGFDLTEFSNEIKEQVVIVNFLAEKSAAYEAGLDFDDVVVAVNGEPVTDVEMLVDYIGEREGRDIVFQVLRKSEYLNVVVVPKSAEEMDAPDGKAKVGISISSAPLDENIGATVGGLDETIETRPAKNVGDAFTIANRNFFRVMEFIVVAPVKLIQGEIRGDAARPASVVAISQIGGDVLRESQEENEFYPILQFIALISIALAITNLLPIPGLDGGRIIFVIIELLRGKPMAPEREGFVHMLGLLLLLSLFAVVVVWDLVDPIQMQQMQR
jgi:regulator of sigma E protease